MKGWKLSVVTGMVAPEKTVDLWASWRRDAFSDWEAYGWKAHVILNGIDTRGLDQRVKFSLLDLANPGTLIQTPEILGPVPAFAEGLRHIDVPKATSISMNYKNDQHIVAFLHDDLRIDASDWARTVLGFFADHPDCVLLGFGGATGVGAEGMYERDFDPMTLARHDFMSNMRDAEAHGERVTGPRRVAVLDGFSLIGRSRFMGLVTPWLQAAGVVHHAYDVAFGCYARQLGLETWLLPLACHHHGGMSAVGDPKYKLWADKEHGGDSEVWRRAHRAVWDGFKGVLPFRVEG